MHAQDVIRDLRQRGVTFQVMDDRLRVFGLSRLTDREKATLKVHKGALLKALATSPVVDQQAMVSEQAANLWELFEERAAIFQFDGKLPVEVAEREAARMTALYARNKGYLWHSVRLALQDYPLILSQLPALDGVIDTLPLGLPAYAVTPSKQVIRQGVYAEVQP